MLDERIHAFDTAARVAEEALRGQWPEAGWRWVTPRLMRVGKARVSLKASPNDGAAQVNEGLPGEQVEVLWEQDDWARVRTVADRYLGWLKAPDRHLEHDFQPDLKVTALRAHAYAGPKISQAILGELCLGAQLERAPEDAVEEQHRRWIPVLLPGGEPAWVQEVCLLATPHADAAALALRFLETPYVWGGRSAWGLDCSGLTQLVFAALGHALPRDADQQQAALPGVQEPIRGDLAFFPGHVGLMLDERRMIHANATGMRVTIETLGEGAYGERLEKSLLGFGRVR